MPKFNVGINIAVKIEVEVEADTQVEAEDLISTDEHLITQFYDFLRKVSDNVRLNDTEWNIDYCEKLDGDNA